MEHATGRLVVISGPSGVGKTSVCDLVLAHPRITRAITATTRAPRDGERQGIDYHFLTPDEFCERIAAGFFLEHAEVYGRRYGTPKQAVLDELAAGRHVLLNIDVQGAEALRQQALEVLTVFLAPPSLEVLEARLRGRSTEDEASLTRRLETAREEMAQRERYDAVVVNDELTRAASELQALILGAGG